MNTLKPKALAKAPQKGRYMGGWPATKPPPWMYNKAPLGLTGRGSALVRVRDNGGGLRPDHKLGFGLTGMRERIEVLGGTLTRDGREGTTLHVTLPLQSVREQTA